MKVLLDSCIWGGVGQQLRNEDYDVVWTGEWEEDPGDREILRFAYDEGRIVITLDKDFGELAVVQGFPHCGIIRLVNLSVRQQGNVCLQVLERYGRELQAGGIATAGLNRVRIRRFDENL